MDYRQMRQKRYLIAAWAFMECVLFGGLLYGWGSLMFVFKQEGIYAELCKKDQAAVSALTNSSSLNNSVFYEVTSGVTSNVIVLPVTNVALINSSEDKTSSATDLNGCPEQDSKFTLCFTIASALFCASSAVLGQINFMFGTRVTRIIAMIIFVSGSLMLAFVSKENPWLIFPGLSFLGAGGLPLLVTNTQVSNLFGKGSSSIVGLLCGGFDISSAVQLLVKIAYESGIARQHSYYFLTALHSLVLVSTFILLPKDFIPKEQSTSTNPEVADEKDITIELLKRSKEGGDVVDEKTGVYKDNYERKELPTLMSCVRQPLYIIHVFWLCILQLRFYYLIGTLNPYLNRVLNKDDKMVSHFTNICFYIMMGGLLSSFLTGVVYDWQKRCFASSRSSLRQNLMPAVLPLAIASFLAVLLSILVLIPVQNLLYLIFITMTLFRSFLYSMAAAFLSAMFPSEYFGLLYGIMIISGGVFGFLQFVFFTWAETYVGAPLHTDIFLLCLVLFSFIHPLYQWYRCSRAEKEFTI
ncbi:hypothetical protein CHS0354_005643 [Potamilus streckersoni]|uniref:Solute carrier family 43 member 3 n=1 Tax=Potamilus streckersoni TaxID=2493646 RepID=A0AAE0S0E9_9BIVA|nr:hypothetical protein CHS0354_005643 [Potamilus streckersoni]